MARRFRKRRLSRQALGWLVVVTAVSLLSARPRPQPFGVQWLPPGDYVVLDVDGGDQVVLRDPLGKEVRLRLLGIEIPHDLSPAQRLNGIQLLSALVAQRRVTLRLDRRRVADDGTLLGYIFAGDLFVNAQLVRQGLAVVASRPEDCPSIVRQLQRAQSEARTSPRGVWRQRLHQRAGLHLMVTVS